MIFLTILPYVLEKLANIVNIIYMHAIASSGMCILLRKCLKFPSEA